uniref:Sulfotransferase n=1 Tax=Ciona savignyi TaxID=51511 RepID=H2Z2N4_CIOSA
MRRFPKSRILKIFTLSIICGTLWFLSIHGQNMEQHSQRDLKKIAPVKLNFRAPAVEDYVLDETVNLEEVVYNKTFSMNKEPIFLASRNVTQPPEQVTSRGLIIMSSMRTGSSFTGQLFNQHPDVFYFFEPLFPLQDKCGMNLENKISTLIGALTCKVDKIVEIIVTSLKEANFLLTKSTSDTSHLERRISNLKKCKESSLCFRSSTKALCGEDLCPQVDSCSKCRMFPTSKQIEEKCNAANLRVIKTVRTCHLDHLSRVRSSIGENFKIIHLVRDPRATALSRLRMHYGLGNITREMKINCDFDVTNLETFKNRKLDPVNNWLHGNYMVVRYDDIVMNPINFFKQTTEFVNRDVTGKPIDLHHPDVLDWLQENTRSSEGHFYSTKRNITQQATKWRNEIEMDMVRSVQSVCSRMMEYFGYRKVTTASELKDSSLNLVLPIPELSYGRGKR